MSDLKPFNSERIYWAVEQVEREAGDIDDLHLDDNLFYLKSEADKVIDELKAKLKVQTSNAEEAWKLKDSYHTDYSEAVEELFKKNKQLRNNKYKRCLAMASKCRLRARWFGDNAFYKKEQWALDWHRCWLELAEKFKEAK